MSRMTKAQLVAQLDGERRTADRLRHKMSEVRKALGGCDNVLAELARRRGEHVLMERRNRELEFELRELRRLSREELLAVAGSHCQAVADLATARGKLSALTDPTPF